MGAPLFKYKNEVKFHNITLFSANFELYGNVSERIVTLLREVTPLIEVYSIDECFMDLSHLQIEDYDRWAQEIRERIAIEIGIPVSIGVATTKTLAKVASTYAKKHGGVYAVSDDAHREKLLDELPIEDVWGIGWRMAPKLRDKGVTRAGQLVTASDAWLHQQFNVTGMKMVQELRGIPQIPFGDRHDTRKQIMRSRSFGHKVRAYHQLESAISSFTAAAAVRLRSQDSLARQIVVFLSANRHVEEQKRVYLSTVVKLPEASADTARFISAAIHGLEQIYDEQFAYQKAGVIIVDIMSHQQWQLSMLADEPRRNERMGLMQSIDMLNKRFGHVVYHASEKISDSSWQSKHELRSPRYTTSWAELPSLQ